MKTTNIVIWYERKENNMGLFKTVDDKFEKLGFKKTEDNKYIVEYEKNIEEYGYVHKISLCHKASGRHIIQSYENSCNKDKLNNMVGLTPYEAKLCIKKMKQKGWA